MKDWQRRTLIGAGIGGGGGALLGAVNALKDHGVDTTAEDVLEQMWNKGSVGALGGAGIGALGHLIYEAKRNVAPPLKDKIDISKIDYKKNESALNKLEQGIADEKQQAHKHVDALLNTPPVPINKLVDPFEESVKQFKANVEKLQNDPNNKNVPRVFNNVQEYIKEHNPPNFKVQEVADIFNSAPIPLSQKQLDWIGYYQRQLSQPDTTPNDIKEAIKSLDIMLNIPEPIARKLLNA